MKLELRLLGLLLWHSNIQNILDGDGVGVRVVVAHFSIDEDLGTFLADVSIVDKDAATSNLVFLKGICNGYLIFGYKPHVAIDTTMIGEVELRLLLARRIGLVVAIIGLDGNDKIITHDCRKGNGDGQIAAFMLFNLLTIEIDSLFAHNGFEVKGDVTTCTLFGQCKVLTIPHYALIVATTTGLSRHQLNGMRRRDHLPLFVVEVLCISSSHIAQMEAPASVEVPNQTTTLFQGKEAGNGGLRL